MNAAGAAAITGAVSLVVIAAVHVVFLGLLGAFLVSRRGYDRRERATSSILRAGIDAPLRAWLVAGAHPDPVVRALRALPPDVAVACASRLARQEIPERQRAEFAVALRGESWLAAALGQAGSRSWWRRLEAARMLSLVAGPGHRVLVMRLLADPHPAVQVAAAAAFPRIADPPGLAALIDLIPDLPPVVRHQLAAVLREARRGDLASRVDGAGTSDVLPA